MKRVYIIKLLLSCFAVTIFFIGAASCKSNDSTAYEKAYEKAARKAAGSLINVNGTQISGNSSKDGSANDIIIPISDENSIKHEHKDIN